MSRGGRLTLRVRRSTSRARTPAWITLAAIGATALVLTLRSGRDQPAPAAGHAPTAGRSAATGRAPVASQTRLAAGAPLAAAPVGGVGGVDDGYWSRVDALERRIQEAPGDTAALLDLARLRQDAHRPAEAAASYARYLELVPDDRQAWLDLANAYAELGRWEDAHAATDSLLARSPTDPQALYNAGAVRANLGRTDEALAWWRRAARQRENAEVARLAQDALTRVGARP